MKQCSVHKRYRGISKPLNGCGRCLEIWKRRHNSLLDDDFDLEAMIQQYAGKDKISGRPIRLNQIELQCKPGKDYAQLMPFGDVHLGYPQCDLQEARKYLDWARRERVYVLLMGDLLECGTTKSVGNSVYVQKLNPQKQMEATVELLEPLAAEELIIGLHEGNHEQRISKDTSIDLAKLMAKDLNVPYLGFACWSLVTIGNQKYSLYSMHGRSGARFKHTKAKAVVDQVGWLKADILAMGHVHSMGIEPIEYQTVDMRNRQVIQRTCHCILTGSYIRWDRSYAQAENYPITAIGSPTIKLMSDRHMIAGSVSAGE